MELSVNKQSNDLSNDLSKLTFKKRTKSSKINKPDKKTAAKLKTIKNNLLAIEEILDSNIPKNANDWNNININYVSEMRSDDDSNKITSPNSNKSINNVTESSMSNSDDSLESIILGSPRKLKDRCFKPRDISFLLPVAVAESVTAGAVSNTLCSEPGSSNFFLGGIIAYNMITQEKLLGVDAKYAEENNFANPFTTFTMAKNVTEMFQSRIGLSTTGFSLPLFREANLEKGMCEIDIKIPYAYICLYDALCDTHKIFKVTNDDYLEYGNQKMQRAQMQAKIALQTKKIFEDYCHTQV